MVSARRAETRWLTRAMPLFLAGCAGFTTYVMVKRICCMIPMDLSPLEQEMDSLTKQPPADDFFISTKNYTGASIAFLVLYFIFFFLMLLTYVRVFLVIQRNPGVTPLGPSAVQALEEAKRTKKQKHRNKDLEDGFRYEPRPDRNSDIPGLEAFYSKDVFVCENDGMPRWCSRCCNYRIDRVHHCSELERCVRKMDHFCPWVGGVVGETSFKFFVQFTFYASLCSIVVSTAAAIYLKSRLHEGDGLDGFVLVDLILAAVFALFTLTMTLTSVRYILMNLTAVDYVKSKNIVHQLAIRVPRGTPPGPNYNVITYPLPHPADHAAARNNELLSARDQLATRTFAIVKTEKGENPWDLGYSRNWKSIMGDNIIDWLLPLKDSPCSHYENNVSFYEMGPLYHQLRIRFGLPELPKDEKVEI